MRNLNMKFRGVLADTLSRLVVAFAVPPFCEESGCYRLLH
jgi:hypothetical protein